MLSLSTVLGLKLPCLCNVRDCRNRVLLRKESGVHSHFTAYHSQKCKACGLAVLNIYWDSHQCQQKRTERMTDDPYKTPLMNSQFK